MSTNIIPYKKYNYQRPKGKECYPFCLYCGTVFERKLKDGRFFGNDLKYNSISCYKCGASDLAWGWDSIAKWKPHCGDPKCTGFCNDPLCVPPDPPVRSVVHL